MAAALILHALAGEGVSMTGQNCLLGGLFRGGLHFRRLFRFSRVFLPDEVLQLDAARIGCRFPGSGAGGLRQLSGQGQGAVPVLCLSHEADGGKSRVVEPVPVPALVGGTAAGRMDQNGSIVIQGFFLVVQPFVELGPLGKGFEFPCQSRLGVFRISVHRLMALRRVSEWVSSLVTHASAWMERASSRM